MAEVDIAPSFGGELKDGSVAIITQLHLNHEPLQPSQRSHEATREGETNGTTASSPSTHG